MDQAVINAIKMRYKRKLMLKLVVEDEDLPFEERLKKVSLQHSIDWLAAAWDEISSSTIENSWKKLIPCFPECGWNAVDFDESDTGGDMKALITAVDALAGTKSSDEEIESWMVDRVYDDDQNPAWLTSVVFTDAEIIDTVLDEKNENAPSAEEIPEESANTSAAETSFSSVAENEQKPEFSQAIQSLDCLIRFVQDDVAEVIRLKSLRTKLIESEWQKRAL